MIVMNHPLRLNRTENMIPDTGLCCMSYLSSVAKKLPTRYQQRNISKLTTTNNCRRD